MDMEYKIKELAKILTLDIGYSNEVARVETEPTEKLLEALNILVGYNYYSNWCYEIDYLLFEIEKDTYTVVISAWVNDEEINDAVALKNCDFETISILMKIVKEGKYER